MARFFRRGISEVHFLPAVASLAAPTAAEITAGEDLTPAISEIQGFQLNNSPITTPDLSTTFDSQIDGPDAADDSGLIFYDDDVDDAIRTALAKGTDGFVVLMPYGNTTSKRCEVWPARSTGYNDEWSLDAVAARARAGFAITAEPEQDAVITA